MIDVPTLSTDRLQLRGWFETDRGSLATIKAEPRNWQFVSGRRPLTTVEASGYLDQLTAEWERWGIGSWAVVEATSGTLLGDCGIKLTDRGPQLAYMLR